MKTVYMVSGPLGVGKTTVSGELCGILDNCALVDGDQFLSSTENTSLSWSDRLKDAWQKIIESTSSDLENSNNVVIDFVVEDELSWLYREVKRLNAVLKYAVLIASEDKLLEGLKKRGDLKFKDRSLHLLEQLLNNPLNKPYILYVADKSANDIAHTIIDSGKFVVENL